MGSEKIEARISKHQYTLFSSAISMILQLLQPGLFTHILIKQHVHHSLWRINERAVKDGWLIVVQVGGENNINLIRK